MKTRIRLLGFINIIIFTLLISGCSLKGGNSTYDDSKANGNKIKIGFSLATLCEERWLKDRDIFVSKAKGLGADVIVQVANNSEEEQFKQAKRLVNQGIDVLVIVPQDYKSASSIVEMARKKGVKVVCYDRLIGKADADLYVSFDNEKVGQLMASAMVKAVPSGNYVIINGAPTDNNCNMFNKGYYDILNKYINKKKIFVRSETWVDSWSSDEAADFVERCVKGGYKLDGIIAANDSLAEAAIDVLAENRLAGKVKVVGHDADLSGCQRVAEGTQIATIYKPIEKLAEAAVEACIKMARGKKVRTNMVVNDGAYGIPSIIINPILVTRENLMQTVIKDGFHPFEDVYSNVPVMYRPKNTARVQ